jgi:hypothetical protein
VHIDARGDQVLSDLLDGHGKARQEILTALGTGDCN